MLNYFNFADFDAETTLLTNDFGRFHFLPSAELPTLVREPDKLPQDSCDALTEKRFILPANTNKATITLELRHSRIYLFAATSLHIFVLTNACNGNCVYCQAQSSNSEKRGYMSVETARRAVDIALESPQRTLSFEFQGGEPLLNFAVLREIVEYAEAHKGSHMIQYNLVSNLSLLTDEMIVFFAANSIALSTSLDGHRELHNANRPIRGIASPHEVLRQNVARLRATGISPGTIQTTTRQSLTSAKQIIDEYAAIGQTSIFLRPLTPLGAALEHWNEIGYTPSEYGEFYRAALEYIIELNLGGTEFREGYATLVLPKILNGNARNYMELRSPCGAAVGQLAYYYNGDIYTCDEARMLSEMGDDSFKLGNISDDSYDSLLSKPLCRSMCSASCLEAIPGCCDCVYQPYCGACPVVSLSRNRSVFPNSANDYHCQINKSIFRAIFEIIKRGNRDEMKILESWAN